MSERPNRIWVQPPEECSQTYFKQQEIYPHGELCDLYISADALRELVNTWLLDPGTCSEDTRQAFAWAKEELEKLLEGA